MSAPDPVELSRARDELLRRMYVAYFTSEDHFKAGKVKQEHGWDEQFFQRALADLAGEHLVRWVDSAPSLEIKPAGIMQAERLGLTPADLLSSNRRVRPLILAKYAEVYEAKGWQGELHYHEAVNAVSAETGLPAVLVEANQQFLVEIGQLQDSDTAYFKISSLGLDSAREGKRRSALLERFEELRNSSSSRQERGRRFQSLFGVLARTADWRVDESVLAPGEETDLILNRNDSFYMVECRWKKEDDPASAPEIRDFAGKLQKRTGIDGIFVSMSGYTSDATDWVEGITGQTPIILVGPGEVVDLFAGALGFNAMLTEKKRALVLQRRAPWR
jgi:hypothetical protein